jgi:hypothetical protein
MYKRRIQADGDCGVGLDRVGRLCLVGCIYGLLTWGYTVALQISNPESVYNPVAFWVPIRVDYFGEIAYVISFLFAIALALRREGK